MSWQWITWPYCEMSHLDTWQQEFNPMVCFQLRIDQIQSISLDLNFCNTNLAIIYYNSNLNNSEACLHRWKGYIRKGWNVTGTGTKNLIIFLPHLQRLHILSICIFSFSPHDIKLSKQRHKKKLFWKTVKLFTFRRIEKIPSVQLNRQTIFDHKIRHSNILLLMGQDKRVTPHQRGHAHYPWKPASPAALQPD